MQHRVKPIWSGLSAQATAQVRKRLRSRVPNGLHVVLASVASSCRCKMGLARTVITDELKCLWSPAQRGTGSMHLQMHGQSSTVLMRSADLGSHRRRVHICICMRLPLVCAPREPSRTASSSFGECRQGPSSHHMQARPSQLAHSPSIMFEHALAKVGSTGLGMSWTTNEQCCPSKEQ